MTAVWMLEDLEPWPDAPAVGDVFVPTTHWLGLDTGSGSLPEDVRSTLNVEVQEHITKIGTEWEAKIGDGFTTMLPRRPPAPGPTRLQGCLMWDRYLWLDYRTTPRGHVRLLGRPGHIVQRQELTATIHPGMFSVSFDGPLSYCETDCIPDGFGVRWDVLLIETTRDTHRALH